MKKTVEIIESLKLSHIIVIWLLCTLLFGLAYYGLTYSQDIIYRGEPLTTSITGFANAIYFSLITATTIGYGDIAPQGIAKVLAIIEAIISMTLFGLFIGKIVSIKQDALHQQIKQLTIAEACNNTISTLYLVRSDIKELAGKIQKSQKKTKPSELESILCTLNQGLSGFIQNPESVEKTQREQTLMHVSLIANSLGFSLSKLVELLEAFNSKKINWKKESATATHAEAEKIMLRLREEFDALKQDDQLSKDVEEKLEDLNKVLSGLAKTISKS
jgi:hypothetical protein